MEIANWLRETYGLRNPSVAVMDATRDALIFRVQDDTRAFVLKQIAHRSRNSNLETIYAELATLSPGKPRLVLPLRSRHGAFVNGHSAILMPYVPYRVATPTPSSLVYPTSS